MGDFTGKVVAIMGAATPIGEASAVLYAKRGATLVICDSDEAELNVVAAKCFKEGLENDAVCFLKGDPTDPQVQREILREAIGEFKRLDILVNAMDVKIPGSPIPGVSIDDFNRTLDKNLKAITSMCLAAVKLLRETKGNIVNVSSSMGQKAAKNYMSYCVSKAGLDMLTKCLAKDLARYGIRVNSVNPFITLPDKDHGEEVEEFLKAMAGKVPMERLGKSEEVAEAILFLSSNKASFITGQLLGVDGGASL